MHHRRNRSEAIPIDSISNWKAKGNQNLLLFSLVINELVEESRSFFKE